jgi:hypothetical protein
MQCIGTSCFEDISTLFNAYHNSISCGEDVDCFVMCTVDTSSYEIIYAASDGRYLR